MLRTALIAAALLVPSAVLAQSAPVGARVEVRGFSSPSVTPRR